MYFDCITCPKIGVSCDGPNFVTMNGQQIFEWCKQRKNFLRLTNAKLAELSGIPKGTVDRIFAGEHIDFKWETMRPIIKVLVGASFEEKHCPAPSDPQADAYTKETIERLKEENERLKNEGKENTTFLKEQLKIANDNAKGRKTAIIVLGIALGITLLCIIAALIADLTIPDVGFFWMEDAIRASKDIAGKTLSNRLG